MAMLGAEQAIDKYWAKCFAPGRRLRFSPGLQTSLIRHSNIKHVSFTVKGNLILSHNRNYCQVWSRNENKRSQVAHLF